jgi:glycosyltransferase involved in cell wall biosynthesis
LLKLIKIKKPDVIYWRHNKKGLLKTSIISKMKSVKFVFSLSHINDVTRWVFKSGKKNKKFPIQIINNIIVIRKSIKDRINYCGYLFTDAVVTLNEKFLASVPKNIKQRIYIRNSMDSQIEEEFKWDRPYIVWVANIKKEKNPEIFIDLAKQFESTSVDFLLIGNIQDNNYNYILDKNSLPSNLYYLGSKSPSVVNSILKNSLFLVHTCNPEGFGNNFIQAWLQGKPTVTLYFDPDNLIKNNKIGFHSKDVQRLYENVHFYIYNHSKREKDGLRAKNFAIKEFSPQTNVRKLEGFLQSILNK